MWSIPLPLSPPPGAVMQFQIARGDIASYIVLQYLTFRFLNIAKTIDKWVAAQNVVIGTRYIEGNIYICEQNMEDLPNGLIYLNNEDYQNELYTAQWYITAPEQGTLCYRQLAKASTPILFAGV